MTAQIAADANQVPEASLLIGPLGVVELFRDDHPAPCCMHPHHGKMLLLMTRRNYLGLMGAGLSASALGFTDPAPEPDAADDDRERRMKWWHDARFGMFIHWGLYSVVGRHE